MTHLFLQLAHLRVFQSYLISLWGLLADPLYLFNILFVWGYPSSHPIIGCKKMFQIQYFLVNIILVKMAGLSICCFLDNGGKPPSIDLFWSRPCQPRPTTLSWCCFVRVVKIFMKETLKKLNIHEQNPPKKYIVQPLVQMVKDKTRCQVKNIIITNLTHFVRNIQFNLLR